MEAEPVILIPASSSRTRINDLHKKQRVIFKQRLSFLFSIGLTPESEVSQQSSPNSPKQLICANMYGWRVVHCNSGNSYHVSFLILVLHLGKHLKSFTRVAALRSLIDHKWCKGSLVRRIYLSYLEHSLYDGSVYY